MKMFSYLHVFTIQLLKLYVLSKLWKKEENMLKEIRIEEVEM